MMFDAECKGYLREIDVEDYIQSVLPALTMIDDIEDDFAPFYVHTVVSAARLWWCSVMSYVP